MVVDIGYKGEIFTRKIETTGIHFQGQTYVDVTLFARLLELQDSGDHAWTCWRDAGDLDRLWISVEGQGWQEVPRVRPLITGAEEAKSDIFEGFEPGEVEAARLAARLELSIIPHETLKSGMKKLRAHQLRSYVLHGSEAQPGHVMLLTGAPGSGKSTLLKLHEKKFPTVRDADGLRISCIRAEMPSPCTKKGVVQAIYRSMNHNLPADWNAGHIVNEITELVRKHHVRIIMLDEADRIFGKETDEIAKFLVSFLNNVQTSVVLAGAPEILSLNSGYGLWRRTEEDIVLAPYRWDTRKGQTNFRSLLKVFDARLGLPEPANLDEFDLAKRIYVATGGHIGIVSKLLVAAVRKTYQDNGQLDRKLLGEVWLKLQRTDSEEQEIDFDCDVEKTPAKKPTPPIADSENPFLCSPEKVKAIWASRIAAEKAAAAKKAPSRRNGARGN